MKWILSIILIILTFIPTELFFLIKHFIAPVGFWQNIIIFGGGIWLLGGLQILFLFLGIIALLALIDS